MKKTLTVNLGGTVYQIDEDAYALLENYLTNLRVHFRKEKDVDEIVRDIECRIAELFSEKINLGFQVVTIDYVEDIINRMGKPEDLGESEENAKTDENKQAKYNYTSNQQTRRRLYRNPDDKILGGVAGGIAAYMGWDPTLLRIALIVFAFIPYFPVILIYIVCWILLPLASTATEKLAMKGEDVTIENIGKTVTDGFERVADGVNNYIKSGRSRTALQKVGDAVVQVVGLLLKAILVFTAIVLSPVLLVMIFVFFILILAAFGLVSASASLFLHNFIPMFDQSLVGNWPMALAGISGVLLFGIPLFSLVYLAFRSMFNWRQIGTGWKSTLLIIWILALVGIFIFGLLTSMPILNWHYLA